MGMEITTVKAGLEIQTSPARLQITRTPADYSMERTPATPVMHREAPKVEIDATDCWRERGNKRVTDWVYDEAARGMQNAQDYAGKMAEFGNQMAKIEDGRSAAEVIADFDASTLDMFQEISLNVDVAPKSRPKITVTGGGQEINWNPPDLKINYTAPVLTYNWTPSNINVTMNPPPSISMHYVDEKA